jgi:hypothetical protein
VQWWSEAAAPAATNGDADKQGDLTVTGGRPDKKGSYVGIHLLVGIAIGGGRRSSGGRCSGGLKLLIRVVDKIFLGLTRKILSTTLMRSFRPPLHRPPLLRLPPPMAMPD